MSNAPANRGSLLCCNTASYNVRRVWTSVFSKFLSSIAVFKKYSCLQNCQQRPCVFRFGRFPSGKVFSERLAVILPSGLLEAGAEAIQYYGDNDDGALNDFSVVLVNL